MIFNLCKVIWISLFLLLTSVMGMNGLCAPVCEQYRQHPAMTLFSGSTHFLRFTHSNSNGSFMSLSNNKSIPVYASRDDCNDTYSYSCSLSNVTVSGGGNFTVHFVCATAGIEKLRGQPVVLGLVMEPVDRENGSNCHIFVDVVLIEPSSYVTKFTVERRQQCIVMVEGCFPPCCGSNHSISKFHLGGGGYAPTSIVNCSGISFTMSIGDTTRVYNNRLRYNPLSSIELTNWGRLSLNLTSDDIGALQNCFQTCSHTLDIGQSLRTLNNTAGCFNVNVNITTNDPFDGDQTTQITLLDYEEKFTYCEVTHDSSFNYYIMCIGFNPSDRNIQEEIILQLSYHGECSDGKFTLHTGQPETVPCMDRRCQQISSFNINYCLMVCVENVATKDDTIDICERIAEEALEGSLSRQNVTVIEDILMALANSSGQKQLETFSTIMKELLQQLEQEVNIHLMTADTGKRLVTLLDHALRNNTDRLYPIKTDLAPRLLENLDNVAKLLAKALKREIISPPWKYNGTSAVVLMTVEEVQREEIEEGYYTFPKEANSYKTNSSVRMEIPESLLCGKDEYQDAAHNGIESCPAVVATVITKHLPQYLDNFVSSNRSEVNSLLLLAVIVGGNVENIASDPVYMYFSPTPLVFNYSNETCVFWDPAKSVWSSSGVYTDPVNDMAEVVCRTTHLTSFAVLVDPASAEATAGRNALRIVSYIGCAISLACLLLSLLIFVIFGRALNKGVLLYIHINFVISLSLALAVFVIGIESATSYNWLCTVVAALLHYLFLCVFCWMLAEGLMLYMLVVRVFGTAAEKWYYLLLLGWGLPLPVVAISLGIRHKDYGTDNYCWLSQSKGTYWAFLGPMITIILINSVILVVTIGSMIRSRKKFTGSKDSKNMMLVMTTVKSTVILLPLLGLTWIIGPFALLKNTDMFAWTFAIFNSLQGFFFFLLHVLRNEKVYESMKKCVMCIPASVMEKQWSFRDLSSNINLASAESVTTGSDPVSQTDCERVTSPPFSIRLYQRKCSEGSTASFSPSHNNSV